MIVMLEEWMKVNIFLIVNDILKINIDHKEENQSHSISNNYKKRATKKNSTDCYVPSFYENNKDYERRPVSISQNKLEVSFLRKKSENENDSYYAKMNKAKF